MLRKIKAEQLFAQEGILLNNAVLIINEEGVVQDILPDSEVEPTESYKGIIVPGFVNAHCHLELSHLKERISRNTGLDGFIKELMALRNSEESQVVDAMKKAEIEMLENGIVAVGDISNTSLSFNVKSESKLFYHTFIEVYGFDEERASSAISHGIVLKERLKGSSSITPHAPYSASRKLLSMIKELADNETILSIHNQESLEEDELFKSKSGKAFERLKAFGIETGKWNPPGTSSIRYFLPELPASCKVQLVHNTYTGEADVKWALSTHNNLYFCLCPKANLYIEGVLPDIAMFIKHGCKLTIGTDSLASNNSLNIWDEITVMLNMKPAVNLETLLQAATLNGAEFLGIDDRYGSFKKGKKPGVNHIENNIVKRII